MATKAGERAREAVLSAATGIMRNAPSKLSARAVARALGRSHQAVLYHFKTTDALRNAVIERAVAQGDGVIIDYLRATGHAAVARIAG